MEQTLVLPAKESGEAAGLGTPGALALLTEMKESIEQQNKLVKRRTLFSQLTLVALLIIMVMLVIGVAYVVPPIVQTLEIAQETMAVIGSSDVPGAIASVEKFAVTGEQTLKGIDVAVQNLETLDVATLNKAISELEATIAQLSGLDIATLNAAIANLNLTIKPLASVIAAIQNTLRIS